MVSERYDCIECGTAINRKNFAIHNKSRCKECYAIIQRARDWLNAAVRSGELIKPTHCERCNKKRKLHGHHEDYTKPLDVNWVCYKCHHKYYHSGKGKNKPRIGKKNGES